MATITRRELSAYQKEGWTITEDKGESIKLTRPSNSRVGTAVRSTYYTLTAPFVFTASLAASAGCFAIGLIAGSAGAPESKEMLITDENGDIKRVTVRSADAVDLRDCAVDYACSKPCEVFMHMNTNYANIIRPFGSAVETLEIKIKND